MGGGVHAAGEAGHHGLAGPRQGLGQFLGDAAAGGGGVAGADQGHGGWGEGGGVAEHGEGRGRILEDVQQGGVAGGAGEEEAATEARHRLHLPPGSGFGRRSQRAAAEAGQRRQRRGGGPEAGEQAAEGLRPDTIGTGEAQPGQGVRRIHPFRPIRGSVPAISRSMFALCRHTT
jgi:hypothetical protein